GDIIARGHLLARNTSTNDVLPWSGHNSRARSGIVLLLPARIECPRQQKRGKRSIDQSSVIDLPKGYCS
ncbi:hypothetical protein A2U01_0080124, partial [Trifolium medium]|nr:hypothetical protein [Trifolium medium]